MNFEKTDQIKNNVKLDTNSKTNCFNNYHSYILCKRLVKDSYYDYDTCKELENFLLTNCEKFYKQNYKQIKE